MGDTMIERASALATEAEVMRAREWIVNKLNGKAVDLPGEAWKPCVIVNGNSVSNLGRVRDEHGTLRYQRIKGGYATVEVYKDGKSRSIPVHRMVLSAFYGEELALQVDHINRCKTDNRLENLRWATQSQNQVNSWKRDKPFFSNHKGVTRGRPKDIRAGKPYVARLYKMKKVIYLGRFTSEDVAAMVRDMAAVVMWGEYADLNFPHWFGVEARKKLGIHKVRGAAVNRVL